MNELICNNAFGKMVCLFSNVDSGLLNFAIIKSYRIFIDSNENVINKNFSMQKSSIKAHAKKYQQLFFRTQNY